MDEGPKLRNKVSDHETLQTEDSQFEMNESSHLKQDEPGLDVKQLSKMTDRELNRLRREARKKKWLKRFDWLSLKIQAIVWIAVSMLTIYETNFFRNVWENPNKNQFFFTISIISMGVWVALLFYMSVYIPYVLKVEGDIEVHFPNLIPAAALVQVTVFLTMMLAVWPLWGFWTPVILTILFMGFMMQLHFWPANHLGNLMLVLVLIGAATTSHLIPHEGKWHHWDGYVD